METLEQPQTKSRLQLPRGRALAFSATPLVMGVVNITPDSFSDGGRWLEPERAVEHALDLLEDGADLVDLGAESTRPGGGVYGDGAVAVSVSEETDRLLPVLERLRPLTDRPISIDTRNATVAAAALAAGGDLINDVSALADPAMTSVVARCGCPLVVMHSRGELRSMQRDIRFEDVCAEVEHELLAAADRARAAGVSSQQVLIDPGIGFGKTAGQNLELLARLDRLVATGYPVLLGASRKSFVGDVTGAAVDNRLGGSLAAVAWAAHHRVAVVRVHDVAETVQFLQVWGAIAPLRRGEASR